MPVRLRLGLEGVQQATQQGGQVVALGVGQLGELRCSWARRSARAASATSMPAGGESDQHATPVGGVGVALDIATGGEAVDAVGHRPARHERLGDELPGAELVGRAGPAKRGQDVELPPIEAVLGEGRPAGTIEASGQPGHPAEDLEGCHVEPGTLPAPRGDDTVDIVSGHEADSTARQVS